MNVITKFDALIYSYIISFKNIHITNFFKIITLFGGEYIILFITFSLMFIKNKKYFLSVLFNMLSIVSLNYMLKIFFLRQRPLDLMIINETGYSYPSGHSMIAVGFYGFILYLIWKSNIKKSFKTILCVLISLLIILIGISRIYLGVHFPSDVIGGYSIAVFYLIIYTSIIRKKIYEK